MFNFFRQLRVTEGFWSAHTEIEVLWDPALTGHESLKCKRPILEMIRLLALHPPAGKVHFSHEAVREWLFIVPLQAGHQAQIIILEILQCIPAFPVKCKAYFSGVVIILAFPRSKSGIFDLIIKKTISFPDNLIEQASGKYSLLVFNIINNLVYTLPCHQKQ